MICQLSFRAPQVMCFPEEPRQKHIPLTNTVPGMRPSGVPRQAKSSATFRSVLGDLCALVSLCSLLSPQLDAQQANAKAVPVLRVKSGDVLEIQTLITSSPKRLEEAGVPPEEVEQSLRDITEQVKDKGPGGHILTGPIYVEDAQPGDALEVKIMAIKLAIPYAYNAFGPGRGYLPDDYPYAKIKIVPLDE